ncbi:MAG: glutaminyl-peptide cyclotransferase [Bacteroidota bacterium]|nr:glutaminyl-peptide cyclotransferase [Flavisolibacter sp.]MBD0349817.1 glutaminyl-peptide cyclotransferase [Flavisolibacter sp.]MDQ3842959.1 glutaminyl-peptide cyclotransferase [Bacteroidota bacterium]
MKKGILLLIPVLFFMADCTNNTDNSNEAPESNVTRLNYSVVASYPHDTSSFTQGLSFWKGQLLEGTGEYGRSRLIQVDLKTGKAIKAVDLPKNFFGEGITILNDTVYQLTWKEHVVHVYAASDLKKIKEFSLNTEGWGITNDGKNLIVSDGSSNLYFYEPSTFRLLRSQGVTEDGAPAVNLNELEYINGYVYANQWQYNYILKIDPNSGQVVGKLDLSDLVNRAKAKDPKADVLNGIAYDSITKKIYVTGKLWPEIYEIQFNL